jgi:transcriptional antiterminator NusG|tara:strand:+ start:474 stop:1064 length:591 start_codon:yes stop_codon:yes gene_type:complete
MKDEAVMTDVVEKNDSSEIKKDWYSLRVISGKERVVEESIAYEAKMNDIADTISEVFVPFEKIVEIKNNKKVLKEKVFFPGYILISMDMNSLTKHVIENIQYVIRFVGPKGKDPIPLRESEIKRIFGEVERKEGREMLVSPFSKGNHVKIIAGPFIDFVGVVEEANDDKQKVKITISIFGRPTPVELDYYQVQLEK